MAQQSLFWTTDGTGDGPSGGYSQQRIYDFFRKVFITDQEASEGVLWDVGNYLSCSGTSIPVTMQDGVAVGYGFFYENTSNFSVTGTSTPSIGTTGGRINLRIDWATQIIDIYANQSADGVAALPSLTQTAATLWELPLYTYQITTGGIITLTDVRSYAHFATKVNTSMLDDGIITNAKMAASSVDSDNIRNNVLILNDRQGGDSSNWAIAGLTDYNPTTVKVQVGAFEWTGTAATDGQYTLTYPESFDSAPIMLCNAGLVGTSDPKINVIPQTVGLSNCIFNWRNVEDSTQRTSIKVMWCAIGPGS